MEKLIDAIIGKRDLSKPNHWQWFDFGEYRITKPTIICLGGNGTKTIAEANAMCRIASSLIGLQQQYTNEQATAKDIDIIGVAYGTLDSSFESCPTYLTNNEISKIVDTLLLPLAVDYNGEKLNFEQAQRNFSNINFFSHCYGAKALNQISFNLMNKMKDVGYSMNEFANLMRQVTSVSYAPMEEVACMNSLQVFSKKDYYAQAPAYSSANFEQFYNNVYQEKIPFSGNYIFQEDDNTVTLLSSAMSKHPINEHCVIFTERDNSWNYKLPFPEFGDEVSQVMGYTLADALAVGLQNQHSPEFMEKSTPEEILSFGVNILDSSQQDLGFSQ